MQQRHSSAGWQITTAACSAPPPPAQAPGAVLFLQASFVVVPHNAAEAVCWLMQRAGRLHECPGLCEGRGQGAGQDGHALRYDLPGQARSCRAALRALLLRLTTQACRDVDPGQLSEEVNRFRKTKLVCTIGPTSCQRDDLFALADQARCCPEAGSARTGAGR